MLVPPTFAKTAATVARGTIAAHEPMAAIAAATAHTIPGAPSGRRASAANDDAAPARDGTAPIARD